MRPVLMLCSSCLFCLVLATNALAQASVASDYQTITMGPFTLNIAPVEEGVWSMNFFHGDAQLVEEESYVLNPGAELKVRSNFPKKGCATMLVPQYSGGAHCCMSLYAASQCEDGDRLQGVGLGHSEQAQYVDVDEDGVTEMVIDDWGMAYFEPQGGDVFLSFAESRPMPRVLFFGPEGWAMDEPGQFKLFYRLHRLELEGETKTPDAGAAMAWLGMAIMEGLPEAEQQAGLLKLLPEAWKKYADAVMQDVTATTLSGGLVETLFPAP